MAERAIDQDVTVDPHFAVTWSGLLNGDTGAPFEGGDWVDRCVQVFGTFGTGGTLTVQGSNNGSNWNTLKDSFGTAIQLTSAGVVQVMEVTRYIRPSITAGDGSTNLTVSMYTRRAASK